MKKKIILTESQVKKLLETRVNDFNLEDITQKLESIDCSGADLKYLVSKILRGFGYKDVKVVFLGHDEMTKHLKYLVHTEGPIFTYKTKSEVSSDDRPCLTIYDVRAYQEI
jgi:hypothetical protein